MPERVNASTRRVASTAGRFFLSSPDVPPCTSFAFLFIRPLCAVPEGLNMEMMPEFSVANVKTQIADTLRLFVGHGRRLSWADLAIATGDKERKLRSYVEADANEMPLDVFMRVFAVLPPSPFLSPYGVKTDD